MLIFVMLIGIEKNLFMKNDYLYSIEEFFFACTCVLRQKIMSKIKYDELYTKYHVFKLL